MNDSNIHNNSQNMITMHKGLKQPKKLLEADKKPSKTTRIALPTKFVFTTEEILQITKEIKLMSATKKFSKIATKVFNSSCLRIKKNVK